MSGYIGLFAAAFIAATLIPAASELGLAALSSRQGANLPVLWAIATLGNSLGAVVNWLLGRYCYQWRDRKWFPFKAAAIDRAAKRFQRFGSWSLLFAWLPLIGDPLTFVAGLLRTPFWLFLLLIATGKGARYAVVIWLVLNSL